MKTSTKLLLSFVGLIVLLMLLVDTVLWANYKRGKSGDGGLNPDEHYANIRTVHINAFHVLKINSKIGHKQSVVKAEKYEITFWGEEKQQLPYSIQNDTMFINLRDGESFSVGCPDLKTVILSGDNGVSLQNFDLPALSIIAGESCKIELTGMKVGVLDIKGGEFSEFEAGGSDSRIDSINLQLGASSAIRSYDVPYNHVSMNVDKLKDLQLTGASLSSMKQIK